MQEKTKIIICPIQTKMKYLEQISKMKDLLPIKFMTKESFFQNYYYSYDDSTVYYLMNKYHYHIDVCKVYLESLYPIELEKNYKSEKLVFLQKLKKELLEENQLIINPNFRDYIKDKEIEVRNYYDLDLYEEKVLHTKIDYPLETILKDVYEFSTQEEEVNFVCLEIRKLLEKGIDIKKISICNVSSDYYYIMNKLFQYYQIPINFDPKESIYSTKIVQDFLETGELHLENKEDYTIEKIIIQILSDLVEIDKDKEEYKILLKEKLKNTYLPYKNKKNAVNIKDLYNDIFEEDEYVFVIGMNQDVFPKMTKDISFINDSIKVEVDQYDSNYLNTRIKNVTSYLLSKIKNLTMSYPLSSPFSTFYKSSLIEECGMNIKKEYKDSYTYSNIYNRIRLGEKLDTFYLYGTKEDYLEELNTHYSIPYKKYENNFTGICQETYLRNLPSPFVLSYTSLNTYNECKFKYYIKYVLKLDIFEDTFPAFIGSLYHKILSLYKKENFNFEEEFQKYCEKRELSLKEKLFLIRIKKDLIDFIEVLKKQDFITGYDNAYYEAKLEVDLDKDVPTKLVGYIDKILYYKKVEDTYYSIIDYKTGTIDTHIEPMKYGLHMQLPVYLYLIHSSRFIVNPIFTGIYYQNILFNYPKWEENLEKEWKEKYYLKGYSTDKIEVLERFDTTYENSQYIKSMKYTEEKGFPSSTKLINDDILEGMIRYTKNIVSKNTNEILEGDFSINPKVYEGKNISCEFCSFKDLCFRKEEDIEYLEKVEDLSFLGGEE